MRTLLEDLRLAARLLAKSPGFALTALATLVLGIVLNAAAFGVVNALWFGPLPFRDDGQIAVVRETNPAQGLAGLISYQDYLDLSAENHVFEGMAVFCERTWNLTLPVVGGEPERMRGGAMSAAALELLGYRPLLGRGFGPDDEGSYDAAGGPRAVLISEGIWRNRFGSDPGVIGANVRIDGQRATIAGVLPYSFRFIYGGYQVIAPLPREIVRSPREDRGLQALARIRGGMALGQVQAELDTIAARLAAQYPASNQGWSLRARPFRQAVFGEAMRMYPILLAAAALVLLIVCANVSNLLLAKTALRRRELAVRLALGAGRPRIVRQLLTEGVLLAGASGALALVAAAWTSRLLAAHYPEMAVFRIDYRVFGYTLGASLGAALAFGLAPALSASGPDLNETLRSGGRGATGGCRLRGALVVSQLAFALMLLAGTGLLVRTVANLRLVDTGYDMRHLAAAQLSLAGPQYAQPERRARFWGQLRERLCRLPGVEAAAVASHTPLLASGAPQRLEAAGRPVRAGGDYVRLVSSAVGPRYLDTAGIRLIAGRDFTSADQADTPRVAIVNEALVKLLWPEASQALGQQIRAGAKAEWTAVVGVAQNARQFLQEPPFPEVMVPYTQAPAASMSVLVRARPEVAKGLKEAVGREVHALDPDLPAGELLTRDDIVEMFYPKVMLGGLGIFATVALALAGIGLYGVISFLVSRRTQEIGVRMALGADRRAILRLVLWQSVRLALAGVSLGLAGAFALARLLAGFLYGMSAADPLVFAAVGCVLLLVALAASLIPAWRAARVDPLAALRQE